MHAGADIYTHVRTATRPYPPLLARTTTHARSAHFPRAAPLRRELRGRARVTPGRAGSAPFLPLPPPERPSRPDDVTPWPPCAAASRGPVPSAPPAPEPLPPPPPAPLSPRPAPPAAPPPRPAPPGPGERLPSRLALRVAGCGLVPGNGGSGGGGSGWQRRKRGRGATEPRGDECR